MIQRNKVLLNIWMVVAFMLLVPVLPSCAQKKDQPNQQKKQTVEQQLPPYKRANIEVTVSPKTNKETVRKTKAEWKEIMTPLEYQVMREKGTERAFNNKYWDNHAKGTYHCAACGNELFTSETKFESGTGWPSFYKPIAKGKVKEVADHSFGVVRTEVVCARCYSHLGHVFNDGPKPTGLRYCLNSVALHFEQK